MIILSVSLVSCTSVATPTPTVTPLPTTTALPTLTSTPTLTPLPTNTPTPTLPPIAATAWASDTSGKVNPQMMYPLVGAVNYKHRKAIDLVYGNVFLAVVTEQDLTKISIDEQRNLRSKLAISLNQSQESQKFLSQVSTGLARSNAGGTKLTIIIEGGKPTQAIVQQTDIARYSIDPNGTLTKRDTRYQLLPKLGIKGKDIVRVDTNEIIRLKGFDVMSSLTDAGRDSFSRTQEYIDIARNLEANLIRIEYNTAFVASRQDQFKTIAERAEKNGMYVIFTASSKSGVYADIPCPDDETISREVELAKLIQPYDGVILDVWNEPQYKVDETLLKISIENAVTRVTKEGNYQRLIFIPGSDMGRNTNYAFTSDLLNGNSNIVYRYNVSLSIGETQYQTPKIIDAHIAKSTELLDLARSKGKPVIIGEFNLAPDEIRRTDLEKRWQEKMMEYIRQNNMSYTQWQLNYYGKGGLLIGTNPKDYKLSQGGQIIVDDLQANPPTQFDN